MKVTRLRTLAIASAIVSFANAAHAAEVLPGQQIENCGWMIEDGETLTEKPDATLKLRGAISIPTAPAGAQAAYCDRETIIPGEDDWHLIVQGFPLIIRSEGRVTVLDFPPRVEFGYHWADGKFVRGVAPSKSTIQANP